MKTPDIIHEKPEKDILFGFNSFLLKYGQPISGRHKVTTVSFIST